ncbi:MAG: MSHA biogenesis protein MshE [marine bacterium B5-7]|nr:MAG: MSHA biogenesis protein MshE [marine bacterium B5-7]
MTTESSYIAPKMPFAEWLYQADIITKTVYDTLRDKSDTETIQSLQDAGYLGENLLSTLKETYDNCEYVDLSLTPIPDNAADLLPEKSARLHKAIVVGQDNFGYRIALANPANQESVTSLTQILNRLVTPVLARRAGIIQAINITYRKNQKIATLAKRLAEDAEKENTRTLKMNITSSEQHAAAVELVDTVMEDAFRQGASDIHFEVDEEALRIRLRVDGHLQEQLLPQTNIAGYIFRRLKILGRLDITEERKPQDGKRFSTKVGDEEFSSRLSILPTQFGQSAVVRILGDADYYADLTQVITDKDVLDKLNRYLLQKQGTFLVTGPTSSGKTTTLYSALMTLNNGSKKIITLENPVETSLPGMNQVQVNPGAGMEFADALRSVLRQDPDVIMIGEIRDEETANMAMRAAITGHMVMATLHTKDVAGTVSRLINLGVDDFLLAAALRLIISQRLVRNICLHCIADYELTSQDKALLENVFPNFDYKEITFKHGAGCHQCQQLGYHGRTGVYEVLALDGDMIEVLSQGKVSEFNTLVTQQVEGKKILDKALGYAVDGTSTLEEVFGLAGE